MNEIQVFRADGDRARGFKTVLVSETDHPFWEHWWPPGHIIGWGDTFVHELHHMLGAIVGTHEVGPHGATFEDGYRAAEVCDALVRSSDVAAARPSPTGRSKVAAEAARPTPSSSPGEACRRRRRRLVSRRRSPRQPRRAPGHVLGELELGRRQPAVDVARKARADDRRRHTRLRERPGDRERRDARAEPLGDRPQPLDEREVAESCGSWNTGDCRRQSAASNATMRRAVEGSREQARRHRRVDDHARAVRAPRG